LRPRRQRSALVRLAAVAAAVAVPFASFGLLVRRGATRLMAAPRRLPEEATLGPALDALGGEVVRLRSRDGTRLSARWLPAMPAEPPDEWLPDPHEAILLLHGWSGSIAPDLVEYAPFLRRTAAVLGLDFGGHGESDDAPTTFGWREVEDVAGALAWLGERGITQVALMGTSMGGITAIAAVAVLGDGNLAGADLDPDAPVLKSPVPRPRIAAVVADSVAPDLVTAVANRIKGGPLRRAVAERLFAGMAARLGGDPRATEPIRVVGLLEPVPLLLIAGEEDRTVPLAATQRLAGAAGPSHRLLVVPGADHSAGHRTDPARYEGEVAALLREAFRDLREPARILGGRVRPQAPGSVGDPD
jgi:pimeloyl-ACP methyl ester carboxylesterase